MSGFSAGWLALREPADHRSRNIEVAAALSGRLGLRETISVVDVGSGTGSNLRATAPMLGKHQSWLLVDNDPALLAAARAALSAWADGVSERGGALVLTKDGRDIEATFRSSDLANDLDSTLGDSPDLVTASALFDLTSAEFIRRFAKAVALRRSCLFATLTYNGVQRFAPRHPADGAVTSAFNRHQLTDKGFGAAAGPMAPTDLAGQFRLAGYTIVEGDSPWRLGTGDAQLIAELIAGHTQAVGTSNAIDAKTIGSWSKLCRTAVEIGHTDMFAAPP